MTMGGEADGELTARTTVATWVISGLLLAASLADYAGYGYFRDELYYLANGRHLGFGYVDHPPFIGLVAALVERFLGTSLFALRLLPALAHAATVVLTACIAGEMGGGRKARMIAALSMAFSPVVLSLFSVFSMNAFDILFWALLFWIVARYLRTRNERWWLAFGVVAGVGLENKISVLFLGFGVACGLLAAGPRTVFRRPWIYAAGLVAGMLFLPHLAWQAANGWPTLEFMRNAATQKNAAMSPAAFLSAQVLNTLPALPVWLAGLGYLLFARPARPYRAIGGAFVAILAVMLATNAKPYYLAPAYTGLFAAGGLALERLGDGRLARGLRAAAATFIVIMGAATAPFARPVLSEDAFVAYSNWLGVQPPHEERHRLGRLPQQFADMHGWPEMAAAIGDVYQRLPQVDRARACVYLQDYGQAGAVELFGPRYGLPPAISGHNSYFLWGPGACTGEVVIAFGGQERDYREMFSSVERAAVFTCVDCMPYESDQAIWILRGIRAPLAQFWSRTKHYI